MFALIARIFGAWLCALAVLVTGIAGAATPPGTTITNTARVSWVVGTNTLTASAQKQIQVSPYITGADLAVALTGPAQVAPGSNGVWKALISNAGPVAADGAQVTLTLPPGMTGISAGCLIVTTGACGAVAVGATTAAGTQVTITLPTFPAGGRAEISFTGTAPVSVGPLSLQAQVGVAGAIDPSPANNTATLQTQVTGGAASTGSLSGHVWLDANHDRVRNAGEFLFQGFTIRIYDVSGTTLLRQVQTDAGGAYTVSGLPSGVSYQLEFRDPAGNVVFGLPVTSEQIGGNPAFANTTTCAAVGTLQAPSLESPISSGSCYSLTTAGSSAQVQRSGRTLITLQPGDNVIEQSLPLDPSGVVYDAVTRLPLAGATVTLNGPPGFDPATQLLGGAGNRSQVTGNLGFYQFLLLGGAPAGNYTLSITPPAGYGAPSTRILPSGTLDPTGLGLGGVFAVQSQATPPSGAQPTTYYLSFTLAPGDPNVVNNHVPLDPASGAAGTTLQLRKTVSKTQAAVGDFVQYVLNLANPGTAAVANVTVVDRLPPGFRYHAGTARVSGVAVTPTASPDGRSLTFNIGTLAAGAAPEISYVLEITVGTALGDALNVAQALVAGVPASIQARATVNISEDLFRSHSVLMGRIIEVTEGPPTTPLGKAAGLCSPEQFFGKGVENARLYTEDGTYVRTDKEGKWHIEGVKPGTHVVQLDVKSLPEGYEPVLCDDNTRRAHTAYSQFVQAQGGTLYRADFYVRNTGKSLAAYGAGHQLAVSPTDGGAKVKFTVKGATAAAQNLSMTLNLPASLKYVPGSARINGAAVADPQIADTMLVFRAGDTNGTWSRVVEFEVKGTIAADAAVQGLTQFLSADGETRRLPPARMAIGGSVRPGMTLISEPQRLEYRETVKATPATPAGLAQGGTPGTKAAAAQPQPEKLNTYAPGSEKFNAAWLNSAPPGLDIVFPAEDFIPGIDATKIFVKHHPSLTVKVTMNGVPVDPLNFEGSEQNAKKTVALSRWGAVGLQANQNKIVATAIDSEGREVERVERYVHYSGGAVEGRFVAEASTLVADGRTASVIAVRMFDATGKPVRPGVSGELAIAAPYQSFEVVQRRDSKPLLDDINNKALWRVGEDGIALIRLQPTTTAGEAVLTFNLQGRSPQVIRAWLKPEMRDWILVGFGEGTLGQRKLSGAIENLPVNEADEKLWKDGRVAFYAKGRVRGDYLMTLAYDSGKQRTLTGGNQGDQLTQNIDRKQYYTLYGDTTSQQYDAASTRKLYLRIEKNQFYALFGDFNTGMTVTELSRYSRTLNGLKSEFRGQNLSYTAFATRTAQAFVKDELRPDGTSGAYRLTRGNILANSETVTIETRDRFRNEVVVKSTPQSRGIDYDIDYTLGTLVFRTAITGMDQNFNPNYIVIDYESEDPTQDERLTAGGRVALRNNSGKAEMGVSAVHEGTVGARADLRGIDGSLRIDDKTRLRAEFAQTSREVSTVGSSTPGTNVSGNAYLVEVKRQDSKVAATVYARGQQGSFGLGQQPAAASGTTSVGADASVKLSPEVSLNALSAYERADAAGTTAERARVEARANFQQKDRSAYIGGRVVRDNTGDGSAVATTSTTTTGTTGTPGTGAQTSTQLIAGGNVKLMDGRLNLRLDAEVNVNSGGGSSDFPSRARIGADYKLNDKLALFIDQEFTFGADENTQTTRIGTKSRVWQGSESANSLNVSNTPDGPVVSTSSSMTQTFKLTPSLTVNAGMDRVHTLRKPATTTANSSAINPLVPAAQGAGATAGAASQSTLSPVGLSSLTPIEDYSAVFVGTTWNNGPWGATGRVEYRNGDTLNKVNLAANLHRDIQTGVAVAATALLSNTRDDTMGASRTLDLRLSYSFRPLESLWIVLSRLDYIQEESNLTGGMRSTRMVTNNNFNYQANARTSIAFQYGAKYVFDSFDSTSVSGYTDLVSGEVRYDLGPQIDVGVHGSVLHSWGANVTSPSYGMSVGYSPIRNLWLGVGYNFAGFRDRDFTAANATAKGWYLYMRMKADQDTLRSSGDVAKQRQLMFEEATR